MQLIKQYLKDNKKRYIEELIELLKIPSISANSDYKEEVNRAAEKVKELLLQVGVDSSEVIKTKGHPVVYAEKIIDKKLPTVIVYGHYDVQPVDPIKLWNSNPFKPIIKSTNIHPEGAIFARGSSDDKGQVFMHIKALEIMINHKCLPCNVKFMIEGEEEIGSKHLGEFIKSNKKLLQGDVILISDTGIISQDTPSITTGLRGLIYVEVEIQGPNRDLHSGLYGGAVANPINILTKMISALQDENNKITIPNFYDDVVELSDKERELMNKIPFNIKEYKNNLNIENVYGEKNYTTIERTSIRPSLDVNGIWGGYIEEGAKTIIPSKAYAKISIRLVPNQKSKVIEKLFISYLNKITPKGVKIKVTSFQGGNPYVSPIDIPEYKAAEMAMNETFGKHIVPYRSGGSIPIVALFEKELNLKSILMGFGLDTDAIHSPNEHFGLSNFFKGIETIPYFYKYYSELKNKKKP